ncbi:glucose dehydrogenase [FAD, quinone] [Fopius arisanus]|uniref:Glucose dehydrogenase [FAD, quinone] n=2 Tax=Fopius arisanus TaxID=64838 RepID=A0A9R1TI96_9HYME|nr:PREDICTED: glucose dehydrogenase [FAD, quinone]-like [Fopius arisanus]
MSYNLSVTPQCNAPFIGPSLAQSCTGSQFLVFMTLLDTFIRTNPDVSQLCERVTPVNPPAYYYDFIVVGGGSAGAVVAARLSDVPNWKVLLLEAGPDEPPGADVPSMVAMYLGSEIDWQYRTINETNACLSSNGSCSWPRGKNLGGTSVHNGMMYIRGNPKDYDEWEAMGNVGWSWEQVLPHFLNMENNADVKKLNRRSHSIGGPLNVERFPWRPPISMDIMLAAKEQGYGISNDLNGDQLTGFTIAQTNSRNGVRVSSARAFLTPVRERHNLHIALNATVRRIIFEKLRAVGVEYMQDGEIRTARTSREIIVSGGAVNSPQLLLQSGIGPTEHLNAVNVPVVKDLPGVGENLQNHVSYTLTYTINESNEFDLNWASALEYVAYQSGPMASTGLSQVTGKLASTYTTSDHPDLQFYFGGYQAACAVTGQVGALMDNSRRSISVSPTNLHPKSRGTIRLASNDPQAKPLIHGNYFSDPQDAAILLEGIRYATSLMNSTALSKYNISLTYPAIPACQRFQFPSMEYWNCAIRQETGPENHQAGSCKMGPANDPMAVVDSKLRVKGILGLRVADTSIMPKVTSGNTAAPAMMIGNRAAAFIKEYWLQRSLNWYKPYFFKNKW